MGANQLFPTIGADLKLHKKIMCLLRSFGISYNFQGLPIYGTGLSFLSIWSQKISKVAVTNLEYFKILFFFFKILIYDIIEVVPEPGKPLTKFRFKEVYIKEQKGPVSAIAHVLGFLVTAVGQKVLLIQQLLTKYKTFIFF